MKKLQQKSHSSNSQSHIDRLLNQFRDRIYREIDQYVISIAQILCENDGTKFQYPTEDTNLELHTACVNTEDFQYKVEINCMGYMQIEIRTAGKIVLDIGGGIYIYPSNEGCEDEEADIADFDTDTLCRFCKYLETSFKELE